MNPRWTLLKIADSLYRYGAYPLIRTMPAQQAHEQILTWLPGLDRSDFVCERLKDLHRIAFRRQQVVAGGVQLTQPLVLAAGFVKGVGFETEADALAAVARGEDIIPGWRAVPALVGPVEFGSFTRYPRPGNPGITIWRDDSTQSTQNRVGLRNPGATAGAHFLARNRLHLPEQFGINIAVQPGTDDPQQEQDEVIESIDAFLAQNIVPTWFTLNLSCPNTEDDPQANQTERKARKLCGAAVAHLRHAGVMAPLWVKISPGLSEIQYRALMQTFADTGVRAVVATNTLPEAAPDRTTAGVGGGRLHPHALRAATLLRQIRSALQVPVDVIGCGGLLDGQSYLHYRQQGIYLIQYYSALIFRGPLAAAIIESELYAHGRIYQETSRAGALTN